MNQHMWCPCRAQLQAWWGGPGSHRDRSGSRTPLVHLYGLPQVKKPAVSSLQQPPWCSENPERSVPWPEGYGGSTRHGVINPAEAEPQT